MFYLVHMKKKMDFFIKKKKTNNNSNSHVMRPLFLYEVENDSVISFHTHAALSISFLHQFSVSLDLLILTSGLSYLFGIPFLIATLINLI